MTYSSPAVSSFRPYASHHTTASTLSRASISSYARPSQPFHLPDVDPSLFTRPSHRRPLGDSESFPSHLAPPHPSTVSASSAASTASTSSSYSPLSLSSVSSLSSSSSSVPSTDRSYHPNDSFDPTPHPDDDDDPSRHYKAPPHPRSAILRHSKATAPPLPPDGYLYPASAPAFSLPPLPLTVPLPAGAGWKEPMATTARRRDVPLSTEAFAPTAVVTAAAVATDRGVSEGGKKKKGSRGRRTSDREKHSKAEQKRRTEMKTLFDRLQDISRCVYKDRVHILTLAIQTITQQQETMQDLQAKLKDTRHKIKLEAGEDIHSARSRHRLLVGGACAGHCGRVAVGGQPGAGGPDGGEGGGGGRGGVSVEEAQGGRRVGLLLTVALPPAGDHRPLPGSGEGGARAPRWYPPRWRHLLRPDVLVVGGASVVVRRGDDAGGLLPDGRERVCGDGA